MGLVLADPAPVLAPQAGVARALPATLLPALTKMTKTQASPEELKVVAAAAAQARPQPWLECLLRRALVL